MFTNLRWWTMLHVVVAGFLLAGCGGKETGREEEGTQRSEEESAGVALKTDFPSYSAAVAAIENHRAHVAELIEQGKLDQVHTAAKPIQEIAGKLNALALLEDSGVPRESLKDINLASKALAKTWTKIDEAGDKNDLAGTKLVYDEIVELVDKLKTFAKAVEE